MRFVLLFLVSLMLFGCDKGHHFVGKDITGISFTPALPLTAHTGEQVSLNHYKGKVVIMFFGFTHCPDICPTTLQKLKKTMDKLGPDADRVQVLFVTVDPERDTQSVLSEFIPYFDKRFIGLTGTPAEVNAFREVYKVFAAKVPNQSGNNYTMDHSAGLYVFDSTGAVRIYMQDSQKLEDMVSDIEQLL